MISDFAREALGTMAYFFVWVFGLGMLVVAVIFVIDITQTTHALRRNYPVIGRFRYLFEHLGEFFQIGTRNTVYVTLKAIFPRSTCVKSLHTSRSG